MALTKLGDYIELREARNKELRYRLDAVRGISIQKKFIDTKADMTRVSLAPYFMVSPNDFAYVTVTSRNGEKITIAHNNTNDTYLVSSSYVVFNVSRPKLLHPDYLFMWFNRPEFDRYARFNSWDRQGRRFPSRNYATSTSTSRRSPFSKNMSISTMPCSPISTATSEGLRI